MSSPAPGMQRLPRAGGEPSLEYTRTVAELGSLSAALNQSGYAFELVDTLPALSDMATSGGSVIGRSAVIALLPMDSAGDTSLRLVSFALRHPLDERVAATVAAVEEAMPDGLEAATSSIARELPIGELRIVDGTTLNLDYTLAVDALGAVPADIVVDVMHLLDQLLTSAMDRLHAAAPVDARGGGAAADGDATVKALRASTEAV